MQSPQEGMPQKCSESTSVMFHSPTLGTENALSRIRRLVCLYHENNAKPNEIKSQF